MLHIHSFSTYMHALPSFFSSLARPGKLLTLNEKIRFYVCLVCREISTLFEAFEGKFQDRSANKQ